MNIDFAAELIDKGGFVLIILFLLSIYVVAVILFKIYQFHQTEISKVGFIGEIIEYVEEKDIPEAIRIAGNQLNPVARVLEVALANLNNKKLSEEKQKSTIQAIGTAQLRKLEAHLGGLEMAANISPLLGLLGTVIGMVKAFASIEQLGSKVDPSVLAGGIWEALLTTVAGLSVAIPALAAYYLLDSKIEQVKSTMNEALSLIYSKAN